ncbi:hypothetical protein CBR_g31220 [Chara braunii]|uniref:Reticulon-like protein n=1 Tax=Chara braunii TaxID=69332 RepID=A0A388JXN5_CHABU|nr:hypothetical protein CBR_g31220 [Chara braunii]|eukprot:GBG62584.1 hypothetical protein CBR_g31220 [Chara braunii]
MIGSWFSFLTLVYIVAVLLFSVPKAYELYESDVDRVALIAMEQTKKYYEMADKAVLSKMPKAPIREKKSQ